MGVVAGPRRSLALALVALAGCSGADPDEPRGSSERPMPEVHLVGDEVVERSGSWAPAPGSADGVAVLATSGAGGFALYTAGADRDFLPGVNLGATVPGHALGELAVEAAHY